MMEKEKTPFSLSEDWWAVIAAFVLILLSALGLLGENGLPISF
ncbi:MAG: hypothetical protein N2049_05685 [Anaerolineales bacterium]|nr:hypothetical protein [Anaerolineales bacterium]MCX7608692.1 hypothetical protein [Anaerolineales bacterium]